MNEIDAEVKSLLRNHRAVLSKSYLPWNWVSKEIERLLYLLGDMMDLKTHPEKQRLKAKSWGARTLSQDQNVVEMLCYNMPWPEFFKGSEIDALAMVMSSGNPRALLGKRFFRYVAAFEEANPLRISQEDLLFVLWKIHGLNESGFHTAKNHYRDRKPAKRN